MRLIMRCTAGATGVFNVSRYRKVETKIWSDEKFRSLSALQPSGQALWFFLLTGPHTGPIPGMFRAGKAAMAEELGWPLEGFEKAFQEAFAIGMVQADFKARFLWMPNAIKHNKPESPNVVRSWRKEYDLLPECELRTAALLELKAFVSALGKGYEKAFQEAFADALPKAYPKTMPNQEQEQEQDIKILSNACEALNPIPEIMEKTENELIRFDDDHDDDPVVELDACTGENLSFENQFLLMARHTGLGSGYSDENVSDIFDLFRCYGQNAKTLKSRSDWLDAWRTWCQREKVKNAKPSNHGSNTRSPAAGRGESATQRAMRLAQSAAERNSSAHSQDI